MQIILKVLAYFKDSQNAIGYHRDSLDEINSILDEVEGHYADIAA